MTEPHGLNRPGTMLVTPTNAAAYAGSRNVPPDDGSAAPLVPAYSTPARAAMVAEPTSAAQRKRPTLTPLSRATLRPLPTNSSRRPTAVKPSRYQASAHSASP